MNVDQHVAGRVGLQSIGIDRGIVFGFKDYFAIFELVVLVIVS